MHNYGSGLPVYHVLKHLDKNNYFVIISIYNYVDSSFSFLFMIIF